MAGKRLPTCRHCGRRFKPCVYNRHHQQWCSQPECRRARNRARNRKYHRRHCESDEQFRQSERSRSRRAMRRLRALRKKGVEGVPAAAASSDVIVGLVSQLAGSSDPFVVGRMITAYADRGRCLAAGAGGSSPSGP